MVSLVTTLTAFEAEAKAMRVGQRKDALLPFQKGIVMCAASVRGLLQDMRAKFGEDVFLQTRHLTQDRLEGFFGMVRGGGGSNLNPTPTEVRLRSRLRLLVLLFAIQRGVRPVSRDDPSASALETAEREEADPADCQTQPQVLEQERLSALDNEVDADLREVVPSQHQPTAEDTAGEPEEDREDEDLAEMEDLLQSFPIPAARVAPGPPTGMCDLETGVSASDSAMAYVAGYVSRKRSGDGDPGAASIGAPDEPLEVLWTRLRGAPSRDVTGKCRSAGGPDGLTVSRAPNAAGCVVERKVLRPQSGNI